MGWNEYFPDVRNCLLKPVVEDLMNAVAERSNAVCHPVGNYYWQSSYPAENGITDNVYGSDAIKEIESILKSIIPYYVNHTNGNLHGADNYEAWTMESLCSYLGEEPIVYDANDRKSTQFLNWRWNAEWVKQKYRILNLMRWALPNYARVMRTTEEYSRYGSSEESYAAAVGKAFEQENIGASQSLCYFEIFREGYRPNRDKVYWYAGSKRGKTVRVIKYDSSTPHIFGKLDLYVKASAYPSGTAIPAIPDLNIAYPYGLNYIGAFDLNDEPEMLFQLPAVAEPLNYFPAPPEPVEIGSSTDITIYGNLVGIMRFDVEGGFSYLADIEV